MTSTPPPHPARRPAILALALVAAIVLVTLLGDRSHDDRQPTPEVTVKRALKAFATAAELHFAEHGRYPAEARLHGGESWPEALTVRDYAVRADGYTLVLRHTGSAVECTLAVGATMRTDVDPIRCRGGE